MSSLTSCSGRYRSHLTESAGLSSTSHPPTLSQRPPCTHALCARSHKTQYPLDTKCMCNAASLFSSTSSQFKQSSQNHLKLCGPSALSAISMFSSHCTPSTRRCKLKEPEKQEVTARRTSGDDNREGPDKPCRPPKNTVAKSMRRGSNGLARQSVGPPPSPPSSLHLLLPLLYHTQHLSSTSCSWCLPRAQCAASLRNWRLADVDTFTQN